MKSTYLLFLLSFFSFFSLSLFRPPEKHRIAGKNDAINFIGEKRVDARGRITQLSASTRSRTKAETITNRNLIEADGDLSTHKCVYDPPAMGSEYVQMRL